MSAVSAEVLRLLKLKDQKILDGQAAVAALLAEAKRQILDELLSVAGDSYSAAALRQNLASIEKALQTFESAAGRELTGQLAGAWDLGEDLPSAAARAAGQLGMSARMVPQALLRTLQDFSAHKISGLAADAFTKIRGELTLGILGQKTPHQVYSAIVGALESPGIFPSIEARARVIALTEMGRAYSAASQLGMEEAAGSVPGLQKQWWHAGHPRRPRQNHLLLHGQVQPVNKPFLIGSVALMYPRDPKAPAREVIACGCVHVPYHPDWGVDDRLPIYNERGEEITRRGQRTGREEDLTGKFKLGEGKKGGTGKGRQKS